MYIKFKKIKDIFICSDWGNSWVVGSNTWVVYSSEVNISCHDDRGLHCIPLWTMNCWLPEKDLFTSLKKKNTKHKNPVKVKLIATYSKWDEYHDRFLVWCWKVQAKIEKILKFPESSIKKTFQNRDGLGLGK